MALVGYWKFDEPAGTSAADSSGNGNTGTLSGGPKWSVGNVRGGLALDGGNDRVDLGNILNFTTASFSITAWMRLNTFDVEIDGVDKTGTMTVPNTGPWDTGWATVTIKSGVSLTAGSHVIELPSIGV